MRLILFTIIIFISSHLYSQTSIYPKNAFYYELLGHTRSIISINYEHTFYEINNNFHLNYRTGFGYKKAYKPDGQISDIGYTFPSVILIEFGNKNHFANFGTGYSMTFIKI